MERFVKNGSSKSTDNGAALIIIKSGHEVVLVKDESKPSPHYWKLPGGKIEEGETPLEGALREAGEEAVTGLNPDDFLHLATVDRKNHLLYVYAVEAPDPCDIRERGEEGEMVRKFLISELDQMVDFFPPHRKILEDLASK